LCGIGAVRTKEMQEHPTIIQNIEVHQRPADVEADAEGWQGQDFLRSGQGWAGA